MRGPVDVPRRSQWVSIHPQGRPASEVPYAGTYLRRLRGLLFGGDQVLLDPCSSVHGFGMSRPLDVAYIDAAGTVIDVTVLKPWRAHRPRRGAKVVWEAPVGLFHDLGIVPGIQLRFTSG